MKAVCVYSGSRSGNRPAYLAAAQAFGVRLAQRGYGLVYGGAQIGLMGAVADAVLAHGGAVVGVIPRALQTREVAHTGLTELVVTRTMHERKQVMADRSDAFVALPGGLGTFEELFEVWTWAQLGMHNKPIGLLDVEDYFAGLVAFVDRATEEGFVQPVHRAMVQVSADPDALLDMLAAYVAPPVRRWVAPEEV